ncbi:transmembrane protein 47-like [Cynoglossus semilaevis]|uniref:transmembrane protein 47-like n=1 Tax=Cynoglossus semilaevis TaxID=244447 RepID=UPI000D62854B|nr:transmembrane protein 47-like [Cynoglossus semilaevis]
MSVNEVYVFRPFKLIALFCVFLALCLDVVALLSPAWVTADHFSLSLWESCSQSQAREPGQEAPWSCFSTLSSGKEPLPPLTSTLSDGIFFFSFSAQIIVVENFKVSPMALKHRGWFNGSLSPLLPPVNGGSVARVVPGAVATLAAFMAALVSLCQGTQRQHYRTVAVFLFTAVVLQACALVLFPIKFIDGTVLQTYHEFNWGYGLGWGATIFMLGAGILFCLRTDIYEDAMY